MLNKTTLCMYICIVRLRCFIRYFSVQTEFERWKIFGPIFSCNGYVELRNQGLFIILVLLCVSSCAWQTGFRNFVDFEGWGYGRHVIGSGFRANGVFNRIGPILLPQRCFILSTIYMTKVTKIDNIFSVFNVPFTATLPLLHLH